MKRFAALLAVLAVLVCSAPVFAVGTITASAPQYVVVGNAVQRVIITLTCTADASAATYPTYTITPSAYPGAGKNGILGWYLYKVETDPGGTGPTNGAWDLDITDARGFVVTRNLVDDRSSTATQQTIFTSGFPVIEDAWSVSIADNAVNSAVVVVRLTFTAN